MQQNASLNVIIITASLHIKIIRHIHQILVSWTYPISCGLKTNSSNWATLTESTIWCYCPYSVPCLWWVNYISDTRKHILFSICNVLRSCISLALMAYLARDSLIACNHSSYPKINTRYIGFCITGWSYRQCYIYD